MNDLKGLFIDGTGKTPKIDFNHLTGELMLSGRSFPENAANVYEPVVNWITEYVGTPNETTNLHLKLEYFNSSSLLWIVKIIKVLSKIDKTDYKIIIHLYFDNDDFDIKDADELRDIIYSVLNNADKKGVKTSIIIHAMDIDGKDIDESTIVI